LEAALYRPHLPTHAGGDELSPREQREYAYGPAEGLPDTKVGTFTQALYDEAKKNGWSVISMKNDWKRIFAFE
jgi:hypothetical protein